MTAMERAVWEDGEGNFYFNASRGIYRIRTSQAERGILADYCSGTLDDGVECRVVKEQRRKTRGFKHELTMYYTEICGIGNVVRELIITNPWRRHVDKLRKIRKLKRILASPKRQRLKKMREAAKQLNTI